MITDNVNLRQVLCRDSPNSKSTQCFIAYNDIITINLLHSQISVDKQSDTHPCP